MKRRLLLILCCCANALFAAAQNKNKSPQIKLEQTVAAKPEKKDELADKAYRAAYKAYTAKDYNKAMQLINEAISYRPDHVEYFVFKAYIYSKWNDNKSIVKLADSGLHLDETNTELLHLKGTAQYFLGEKKAALQTYGTLLKIASSNALHYNNVLDLMKEEEMYDEMIPVYEQFLAAKARSDDDMKNLEEYEADIHFYAAIAYEQKNDLQAALNSLNAAIELSPKYDGYFINRGNVYHDLKKYTQALADFNTAIQLKKDSDIAYYNRSRTYAELDQDQKALQDLLTVERLRREKTDDDVYNNMGNAYKGLKQYKEAEAAYLKAQKINPDNKLVHNNLGILYKLMGQPQKSENAYQQAIQSGYRTNIPNYNLAFDLMKKDSFAKAIPYLEAAIKTDPDFVEAYNQLGICYAETGNDPLAITTYTKGAAIDSTKIMLYINRGNAYKRQGQFDKAEKDYFKALSISPKEAAVAYYSLAILYRKRNNANAEKEYFNLAAAAGVDVKEFYIDYLAYLSQNGMIKTGVGIADKALQKYPEEYFVLLNASSIYDDANNEAKSIALLKKAMHLKPDEPQAYYNMANYYFQKKKDLANAKTYYNLAINQKKKLPQAYLNLASVYQDLKQEKMVLQTFEELLEAFPKYAEAYYNRGAYYFSIDQKEKALAEFEKCFAIMDEELVSDGVSKKDNIKSQSEKAKLKAQAYQHVGEYKKALVHYEQFLIFNKNDADAYNNYAYCLLENDAPQQANENFKTAYKLNNNEIDIVLGLIVTQYLLGQKAQLAQYIAIANTKFTKYKLNKDLLPQLRTEGYSYTEKFEKIYLDAIKNK